VRLDRRVVRRVPRSLPGARARTLAASGLGARTIADRTIGARTIGAGTIGACVAVACTLPLCASAAGPRHLIERAHSGPLTALLSYLETPETHSYVVAGKRTTFRTDVDGEFRLSLVRSGRLLFSTLLGCGGCQPAGADAGDPRASIHFARLRAGTEPEALLDLFTGGAHCCFLTDVLVTGASGTRMIKELWGDPGYRLSDLDHDGVSEFVTADDRFAYTFTDYADSALPIEIVRLEGFSLVDVTRSYPQEVEADAASLWSAYLGDRSGAYPDVRGVLAAWAADEALLGRWSEASTALDLALARGDLDQGPLIAGWPRGRSYITALHRFLRASGYL
jgi:hypothetical protein